MVASRRMAIGVAVAGSLAIGGVVLAAAGIDRRGSLPEGLHVGSVAVGSLDVETGIDRVRRRAMAPARIRFDVPGGGSFSIATATLGPVPDVDGILRQEMSSRDWTDGLRDVLLTRAPRHVPLTWVVDRRAGGALLREVARRAGRRPVDAAIVDDGDSVGVVSSRPGRAVDVARLRSLLARMPPVVVVPVRPVPPRVTTGEAKRLLRRWSTITRAPVAIEVAGLRRQLMPSQLRRIVRWTATRSRFILTVDRTALASSLHRTFSGVTRRPRDARFSVTDGNVEIVPSLPGSEVDVQEVASALLRVDGTRRIHVGMRDVSPELSTDEASRLGIREQIAAFRTPYECCPPRVTNIRRAAAILDGTVIRPGASLSLNAALGQRTLRRGFVPAPQINAGRLEDAVGGGVSQIATTFFNAAFFAGLRLDRFTPHQFWISRYPAGREATISWGGPELVVTNDWPAGILVVARADRRGVTIRLYSSRLGRRVTTTSSHPDGAAGAFTVSFTRGVWSGTRLRRSEVHRWTYDAPPPAEN